MMRKVMGYGLLVMGLAGLVFFLNTGCFGEEAADPYTWDFGRVQQGEAQKHEFLLKNDSNNVLNIRDVNTSCGCTVAEIKQRTLAPGESTAVEVKFNSKGYNGDVQQFVYVNTDDVDNPVIRFIIKANVVK